jgi:hypothetical protein
MILQGEQAEEHVLGGADRRPTPGWRGPGVDAEGRVDRRAVVGEPDPVLLGTGLLAAGFAELALDPDQLLDQAGAPTRVYASAWDDWAISA